MIYLNSSKRVFTQIYVVIPLIFLLGLFSYVSHLSIFSGQPITEDFPEEPSFPCETSGGRNNCRDLDKSEINSSTLIATRLDALIHSRLIRAKSTLRLLHERSVVQNLTSKFFLTHQFSHGRLGNWMFQAASLIGIAWTNSRIPVAITSQKHRSQLFEGFYLRLIDQEVLFENENDLDRAVIDEHGAARYNTQTKNLSQLCRCNNQTLVLAGYLQSWKYFQAVQSDIRSAFTFRGSIFQRAKGQILNGLDRMKNLHRKVSLIGIHVRRGDAVKAENNVIGHVPATDGYLLDMVRRMEEKYYPVIFFVVTDGVDYCRKLFKESNNFVFVEGNQVQPEVDMALLTLMDHLILTVGTFGWWGGFLSDAKEIVHFKDWPRNGSDFDRNMNKSDFFPPCWKAM